MNLKQMLDFYTRFRDYTKKMKKRDALIMKMHVDESGQLNLPMYVKRLTEDPELMLVPDEELISFCDQLETTLTPYDPRLHANIRVLVSEDVTDEYKTLFLHNLHRYTYEQYMASKRDLRSTLIMLMVIFVMGVALKVTNNVLIHKGSPFMLTGTLDVIDCVMIWSFVDYLIRNLPPAITRMCRIFQIGTAEFVIKKWN